MNVRSLGLALFLASMAVACTQKMAPTDAPAEDDKTAQDVATAPPADPKTDDKPTPAATTTDKKDDAPAPAPAKTDAPAPAPAKTDDAKQDTTPKDPLATSECLAKCQDFDCSSKCLPDFGFGF